MKKNRYVIAGIIAVVLILVIVLFKGLAAIRRLPDFSDRQKFPGTVQNQIASARLKIYYCPTSDKFVELGRAYHSSANYKEAAQCYQLAVEKNASNLRAPLLPWIS